MSVDLLRMVDRDMLKLASRLHVNIARTKSTVIEIQSADVIDRESNDYLHSEIWDSQLPNDVTAESQSNGILSYGDYIITAAATAPTARTGVDSAIVFRPEATDVCQGECCSE